MNITVTGTNPKLPNVFITKAILQNDSISIDLDIEENNEFGFTNFSNLNYFKYLKFNVSIFFGTSGVITTVLQVDKLPTTTSLSFTNINTTGLLTININTYFDYTAYITDNGITDPALATLITTTLGSNVNILYPVLNFDGELYLELTDPDGSIVKTIVSDYRSIADLENLNLISPFDPETNPIYFNFVKSDVVGTKVNNFVSFNYKRFLRNNSYFSSDAFSDYKIQMSISNSSQDLENIIIGNNTFTSSSVNTKIIKKSDETILFYFEDNNVLNVDQYVASYKFKTSYTDKTYSNFYNSFQVSGTYYSVYNEYTNFKNKVFLAQKFSDYPDNPNIKQPFYLDLSTDRFTNEFVSFCERTDVNLESLITNLVTLIINPFLSADERINTDTINKIISALQFDVSTYSLYASFFKTIDNIFLQIKNNFLDKTKVITKIYNKQFSISEKVDSSYFLIEEINNDGIPKLSIDKMNEILESYNSITNTVRPKFFSNNKQKHEITDVVEFDSMTFNQISSFTKALQDNKKLNLSSQLITEQSYLEKLGVTLSIGYFEGSAKGSNTITSFDKTETFRTSTTSTYNKGVKSTSLSLQDISKADQNLKSKIKETNQFSYALNFGNFKEKASKEEITPKLYLFYYNEEVDGYWSKLTKTTKLTPNMLIKIEKTLDDENIFTKAEVSSTKVLLENNYFIIVK